MILELNINIARFCGFYSFLLLGNLVGQPGSKWNKLAPSLQDPMLRVSYKPISGEKILCWEPSRTLEERINTLSTRGTQCWALALIDSVNPKDGC